MTSRIDCQAITGRDNQIIMQALAYASEMLRNLGLPHDEPSNRRDMDAILEALGGVSGADMHRAMARAKLNDDPECYVQEGGEVRVKYTANVRTASYEGTPADAPRYTDVIADRTGFDKETIEEAGRVALARVA